MRSFLLIVASLLLLAQAGHKQGTAHAFLLAAAPVKSYHPVGRPDASASARCASSELRGSAKPSEESDDEGSSSAKDQDPKWQLRFNELQAYMANHGGSNVPPQGSEEDDQRGKWAVTKRK
mmetsp:Transcript_25609/g.56037  ORF Transcript_25609/g.56037 Transcript_25609/m.56037 type:complete len:121 (+) Transcript_25609:58-420(+)